MTNLKIKSVLGHAYLGCYTDLSSHVLSATSTTPIFNEPQYCCQWCANADTANTICGVEYGGQCYCDSTMPSVDLASASDCNSKCPGDGSVACGGEWRLNIYSSTAPTTTVASPETVTPQLLQGYSYLGCYSDSSDRILRGAYTPPILNDPKYCCEWCQNVDNNYQYCGVQNGDQCFCDSTTFGPANSASAKDCSSSCPGGGDQQCGGYWRVNLYKATGVSPAETATTLMTAKGASAIPSETNTSAPQPSHKQALSGGSIAGIVVGAVAAIALLITALFLLVRRRRSRTIPSYTTEGGSETPASGKFTQANVHELQTPIQSPRAELAESKSEPTLHEMDAGPR
ncbi:hypothetical protein FVEN_g4345 [Fusarium venenatum]|uniref:WSC domain-containing protein n=1 Tax=Fusarium venenatum TaxID=56646 RepID=A0A2L2TE04_9HYPO|nr:uncharacterized protein FVRRES_02775 [Fusarium venenatum]KAG8357674.1 hypothetical protein FVEN_g4345 [Fusarium venenatum]KAH7004145.1 hypothetical protein EDB82DRAFT_43343 [Fusarium venenatum]CEI66263.1 unnamed protein product [Fusarium venenatum]